MNRRSRHLADMTTAEVSAAVAGGATTVIWPLGATEQHGAHLPLATDSIRAEALADRLAGCWAEVLVAPTLPIGCSDEHTGFAGLLGLDHGTLARLIVDVARRLGGWGITRLVLLSAHGGNDAAIAHAVAALRMGPPTLSVLRLQATPAMTRALYAAAAADGISAEAFGLHAGDGETSEMLHLRPELVRRDRAVPGYIGPMAAIGARLRHDGVRAISATGALGDPTQATAGRGARYLAVQVGGFREQLAMPVSPASGGDFE